MREPPPSKRNADPNARLRPALWLLLGLLYVSCLATPTMSGAQEYGLDEPVPLGAFLDGALPMRTPNSPSSSTWEVVDAFPGLSLPNTLVIEANPADGRIYVASRDGVIVSFENDELTSSSELFMDLTDRVATVKDGGFLGLAFHPNFGLPGSRYRRTFFTYYSSYCPTTPDRQDIDFAACDPDYPTGAVGGFFNTWLRLSRFEAYFDDVAQVWRGDPASEEPLFNIRLFNSSHRGGGPIFDRDGMLWVAIGDQFRYDTAQNIAFNFEGGAVRLAVDVSRIGPVNWSCPEGSHMPVRQWQTFTGNPDEMSGRLYCIPDDNPFPAPSGEHFEEFATLGNRNPHRLALDPLTGLIWSGEVGEKAREEINVLLAGRNYQWPYREGNTVGVRTMPETVIGIEQPPVIDFDRSEARAIIGGYVYRGTRFPELSGRFIAGDYVMGNIWAITLDINSMTATADVLTNFTPGSLATFGQDENGEIFIGSVAANIPLQRLNRIGEPAPDAPAVLSQVGAFDDVTTLDVRDAGIPFDLVPFWSDGAVKQRWLFLPNDGAHDTPGEQIAFSETDNWGFPTGTVLMKHLELPVDETDPSLRIRLETRLLVFGDDGDPYGLTYRWRADDSDADLLSVAETQDYTIQLADGTTRQQTWVYPSRTECLQCHLTGAGGALGLRTHQQNRDMTFPATGRTDNQLRTWNHLGMFSPPLDEAAIPTWLAGAKKEDVSASLEFRARSWLDTNCAYCHRPGTGNRASFDARLTTPLADQGLVWGSLIDPLGLTDAYLVHPGNPLLSIVDLRIAADSGALIGMPPLGLEIADPVGTELVAEWILRTSPDYPRPGLAYEYYEETGLTALPDFDALTPVTTGTAATFDISLRLRSDDFAFRFTGHLDVPSDGTWTFYTSSDEGSALDIDGMRIVDNDGLHTLQERSGAVFLTAGHHLIEVTMFERDSFETLNVSWEGPGVSKQAIPTSALVRTVPTPIVNDAPVLASPGDQDHFAGDTVGLQLVATDPDADLLYFDAMNLPEGLSLDAATGLVSGTLTSASVGVHDTVLSVSDGPEVDVVQVVWTVPEPAPTAPLLLGVFGLSMIARSRRNRARP